MNLPNNKFFYERVFVSFEVVAVVLYNRFSLITLPQLYVMHTNVYEQL